MTDPFLCSDLVVHSRYAYARAAAEDGDWLAAAEVLEQALERAPQWPPALFALGEALEKLGEAERAAEAFRASLGADPQDSQGAAARLALLGVAPAPATLPPAYLARLFDGYAPRFDRHLVEALGYRGPVQISEALATIAPGRRFAATLDLGCGTGLAGVALRARVERLTGIDISPAMVEKARALQIYDALEVGEIVAHLERYEQEFDLIVAADAFVYIGDLSGVFVAAARALRRGGLFAFTVEAFEGEGYRLNATMRFSHTRAYVEATAVAAGLRPLAVKPDWARREAGGEAPGLVCAFGWD
ncbi:MAG TPA: methyltransferase domain-containing protein [Roseiarcus sp.]|jgi:predicted TPR repeat methyltransferase